MRGAETISVLCALTLTKDGHMTTFHAFQFGKHRPHVAPHIVRIPTPT